MILRRRALLADLLGLALILLVLSDYVPAALLRLPTITAGGDTPCHYPTAVYFREHLLPRLRLHGWYAGAYLGHPLLLYYFPLPFLAMAAMAPLVGMPVAFKLGTLLGVFLLPLLAYACLRLMGFGFPAPLLGAASAFVFLFVEDNPIWGGTFASTLTGEFSYTYGIGLGLLFLGLVYRDYARGRGPWRSAGLLALTALAHGYAVLWAGISASYFLYGSRRPLRTLGWLAAVALLAFAFAGVWILPLLSAWGWTTSYDDPWITVTLASLFPRLLWPLFTLAALGLARTLLWARRTGGPDHRLLFLLHAVAVGGALAAAGPALGIIDVRFVPFAQLALCLTGGAALGLGLQRLAAPDLWALAFTILALVWGDSQSQVVRYWVDWNYSGLEAKELWPSFRELAGRLKGSVNDPRITVEYSSEHEKAGTIRVYETLPLFSGRSTLEGLYNQASLQTHAVYYLASELDATSPNPFRRREYSRFDTDNAVRHLRLFNVREIVAMSGRLTSALEGRTDVEPVARIPPYAVFRLRDPGPGYVEPLRFAPVRSSLHDWREKGYRWFTRKPLSPVHLVFTDDPRFETVEKDEWLAPPAVPLAGGVIVSESVGLESLTLHTNRVGHPLLIKISYHPRWKAEGADGPYLVSPALMMVVPRESTVRLTYAETAADKIGRVLTIGALLAAAVRFLRPAKKGIERRLVPVVPEACEAARPPRRWGGAIPAAVLGLLMLGRFAARGDADPAECVELDRRATQAYAAGRYEDAAEYARHALARKPEAARRGELRCLRGESLVKVNRPQEALEAFQGVLEESDSSFLPRALFGRLEASEALGDLAAASDARGRLQREFPGSPWARGTRPNVRATPPR